MFRGRYEHSIDAKGRTSLPSRFREVLGSGDGVRLVLATGLDPCVVAYPMQEWLSFEERLAQVSHLDPSVAMVRRIYVSSAIECEVDRLGRLLVPASLRDHAKLSRDVLWAGMGKTIELWSRTEFDAMRSSVLSDADKRAQIAKRLAELGL